MNMKIGGAQAVYEGDLDVIARMKARCTDKLRHHECCAWECKDCETGKEIENCFKYLPDCDKLKVRMLTEDYAKCLRKFNPTIEEYREDKKAQRELELETKKRVYREINEDFMRFGGGWIAFATIFGVPILFPLMAMAAERWGWI